MDGKIRRVAQSVFFLVSPDSQVCRGFQPTPLACFADVVKFLNEKNEEKTSPAELFSRGTIFCLSLYLHFYENEKKIG